MRLWHEALIPQLPDNQLRGQHRECCGLRGKGWGRPHSTINYVFDHPRSWLWAYHVKVMNEMGRRGFNTEVMWYNIFYRGKNCDMETSIEDWGTEYEKSLTMNMVYPEHDNEYLLECLDNLEKKGIQLNMEV